MAQLHLLAGCLRHLAAAPQLGPLGVMEEVRSRDDDLKVKFYCQLVATVGSGFHT